MSGRSFTRASRALVAGVVSLVALAACSAPPTEIPAEQQEVVIAAAASLRNVMPVLIDRWGEAGCGGRDAPHAKREPARPTCRMTVTYGASGDLRKQVEAGAPIDLVLFASRKPVTQLAETQLVNGEPARIATNALVLIGPRGGTPYTFASLETLPPGERLAVGDPGAVPAGDYAKQVLTRLGKWDLLQDRLVLGGDVAAVLAYAKRGEVAAAVVYRTESYGISGITVFDEAPKDVGATPEVVGAVVKTGRNAEGAKAFLAWLGSAEAQKTLADAGFGAP